MKNFARQWLGPILVGFALLTALSYYNGSMDLLPTDEANETNESSEPEAMAELSDARYKQLLPQVQAAYSLSDEPYWDSLPDLFTAGVLPGDFLVRDILDYKSLSGETHVVYADVMNSGFHTGNDVRRVHIGKTDRPVAVVLAGSQLKEWLVDIDPEAKVEKIFVVLEHHWHQKGDPKKIPVQVPDGVQVVYFTIKVHRRSLGPIDSNQFGEKTTGFPFVSVQVPRQNGTAEVPFYKDYRTMVDIPKALIRFRDESELKTTNLSGVIFTLNPLVIGSPSGKIPFFPLEVRLNYKPSGEPLDWSTPLYVRSVGKYFVTAYDRTTYQSTLVAVDPTTKEVKSLPLSISSQFLKLVGFDSPKNELILRDRDDLLIGYNLGTRKEHVYGPRPWLQQVCYHEKSGRLFGIQDSNLLVEYDADLNPIEKTPLHNSQKADGHFKLEELYPIGDQLFAWGTEYPRIRQGGFLSFRKLLIDPRSGLVQELAPHLVREVRYEMTERKPSDHGAD